MKMPDKSQIAKTLIETRDARLLLEVACWVHDLDKASWPFAAYLKLGQHLGYDHEAQPGRSKKTGWTWADNWLDALDSSFSRLLDSKLFFSGLLPKKGSQVDFSYYDPDDKTQYTFSIKPDGSGHSHGNVASLFKYHSAWKINEQPWEPWIISAPFAGPDGIDSDFFKGALYKWKVDEKDEQKDIPPMVATPFGYERPVLGESKNGDEFKKNNEAAFKSIWEKAFSWTEKENPDIQKAWHRLREDLSGVLIKALGYTNRPTNDVNLWAHSYGVAAMAKTIAAALALDTVAAKEKGVNVLFPLRSPEQNLPVDKLNCSDYLRSGGSDESPDIRFQVQTKFKVLSILLRDVNRLHVGKSVGDILGYHRRRDILFKALANIIERDLALGSEIFRDHAGIHFIIPWCQDSLDAHLKNSLETQTSQRSQEVLEDMIFDIVDFIFKGKERPDWADDDIENYISKEIREAEDFNVIREIAPSREPFPSEAQGYSQKSDVQGLLFLKDRTAITGKLERRSPRIIPPQLQGKGTAQLCPICRKRATSKGLKGRSEDIGACETCRIRRESRADKWWEELCNAPSLSQTTIWASEASDKSRQVNLLTIAFDLSRWFNGKAFDGFWMHNTNGKKAEDKKEFDTPIYPAPARILGVWEASLSYTREVRKSIADMLVNRRDQKNRPIYQKERLVFEVKNASSNVPKNGHGVLLSAPKERPVTGDWFLGTDKKGHHWLLGVNGQEDIEVEDLKELVLINEDDKEIHPLKGAECIRQEGEEKPFAVYNPIVDILTDSPTRFQILLPAQETVRALKEVHELFLRHFGKVAHMMEAAIVCLNFKEKFPFYLALATAGRFIENELKRARHQIHKAEINESGLQVYLDESDPAREFLGGDYRWSCLGKEHRDVYRSVVMRNKNVDGDYPHEFYGWDKEGTLMKRSRLMSQPVIGGDFQPDISKPVIEQLTLDKQAVEECAYTGCPRLSWAHLTSPGERHEEQLSIPLLAFPDWVSAYDAVAWGSRDISCAECWKLLFSDKSTAIPEKIKEYKLKGLSEKRTQFRNLIEELIESHIVWPDVMGMEEGERTRVLAQHIRALLKNPNGCGRAWGKWAEMKADAFKFPLNEEIESINPAGAEDKETKNSLGAMKSQLKEKRADCMQLVLHLSSGARRFEDMASINNGRPLIITYDLLNKVCSYHMKEKEPT
jgi:hypothetical protein